jgi:hypothetical protein
MEDKRGRKGKPKRKWKTEKIERETDSGRGKTVTWSSDLSFFLLTSSFIMSFLCGCKFALNVVLTLCAFIRIKQINRSVELGRDRGLPQAIVLTTRGPLRLADGRQFIRMGFQHSRSSSPRLRKWPQCVIDTMGRPMHRVNSPNHVTDVLRWRPTIESWAILCLV